MGGAGGAMSSSSSASNTSSSTSSSSSASTGSGGFMPPVGTADYPAETEQNNLTSTANPLAAGTKGFTASLYPVGDVDVFRVDVTASGSQMRVATSDGLGGCPPGAATLVQIFDSSGSLLASDTDSGPDLCSLVLPANHPALVNLAVGSYYVQIESVNFDVLPKYIAEISVTGPGCGDGIFQSGEECDDGNGAAGDGCTPLCKIEGVYPAEVEPNPSINMSNTITAGGVSGVIQPVGDQDYFSFNVAVAGSGVTLEVSDGNGGCPSGFDSEIYLYDPSGALLVSDDEDGVDSCSLITPSLDTAATNLPAGKYTVMVEEYLNNAIQIGYTLTVKVTAPGCGDGIVQIGEQCDDGNMTAGDGCGANCKVEGNFLTEAEPNEPINKANSLTGFDGATGSIQSVGDQDYFSFDVVTAGSSVRIEVTDTSGTGCPLGFDSVLYLYSPSNAEIASDDEDGFDGCSLLSEELDNEVKNLPAGKYKVMVEEYNNNDTSPPYLLKVKVTGPVCGDAFPQTGEQCDDGNPTSGDGCSATCVAESPWEIEANNMLSQATPLWMGTSLWRGTIIPSTDIDYFSFDLPAGKKPALETHAVGDMTSCPGDTVIHLVNASGMEIAMDDDDGLLGGCSRLDSSLDTPLATLPAGKYYVWVEEYSRDSEIASYELGLTLQ